MRKQEFYAVFDLKSYYASFECAERGLDPLTTPLAVTDSERKEATIVLSVSPYLKSLGVPSRCRRRELPKNIPNLILAKPQMEKYVKQSAEIVSLFLDYFGKDDLHIYSIDELFVHLTPYLKLYKKTPFELCKTIQNKVCEKTKLIMTCGIGPNMFIAKMCDDKAAKKADGYIEQWTKEDIPTKLWPIKPLREMWGISTNYEKRFNKMGIYTIGDLANADKTEITKKFGVIGTELYNHANGIDHTNIRDKYFPINRNLSLSQVLMKDYKFNEIPLIIKEMCDDLSYRLREVGVECKNVHLFVRYSFSNDGGFSHQLELMHPTNISEELYQGLLSLYYKYVNKDAFIRQVSISFTSLVKPEFTQIELFNEKEKTLKNEDLYEALDEIQSKYGKNSLLRTSSLLKNSTAKERHNQIGGHRK